MNHCIQRAAAVGLLVAASMLLACGTSTVSRNVSDDGQAGEVVFPDIQQDAWRKEGSFPNLENLWMIAPGMSKDQLYDLIGRPHFREHLVGVREWDYIFNFRTASGLKTCQYKVIFDTAMRARNFHWKPADCTDMVARASAEAAPARVAERLAEPALERPVPPPAAPRPARRVEISADALFAFGGSGIDDLRTEGRGELDRLASSLRGLRGTQVRITGHTDRLGGTAFNQRLSMARANTVRDYLVRAGVVAGDLQVGGKGLSEPKVQCGQKAHQALVACLAPNRRVEIEVAGEG